MPPDYANRRRQGLRDVFHSIIARTREWPADALLIAGDLFDVDRVTRDTLAFLRAEFESIAPTPVFITPGNHDPCTPASPYNTEPWPDNVHIFRMPQWESHTVTDKNCVVHGFGFDGFDISYNPLGELDIPEDGLLHIAVAHGSERTHQPPDSKTYAPFDAAAMNVFGLAYVALGHFHAFTDIGAHFATRMAYSGAPEGHDFSETGPRHYLEIDIDDTGVHITPVPSARVIYTTRTIDCGAFESSQALVDDLRGIAASTDTRQVARVRLTGTCPASFAAEIPAVVEAVAPAFEYLDLIDETEPLEDFDKLARETTSLGTFVRLLNEEIADAPDPERSAMLKRAREIGLAAYTARKMAVRGLDVTGPPTGRRA